MSRSSRPCLRHSVGSQRQLGHTSSFVPALTINRRILSDRPLESATPPSPMLQPALLPFAGLLYVLRNPKVGFPYRRVTQTAAVGLGSSLVVLAALYTKGWSFQKGVITSIMGSQHSWLAFWGLQVVLAAEAVAVLYLLFQRTLNSFNSNVFDEVLARQGVRKVQPFTAAELEELQCAVKAQKACRAAELQKRGLPEKAARWALGLVGQRVVTAPLLLVPGIGLLLYLYANALDEGTRYHSNYFRRKGAADADSQSVITASRASEYKQFGAVQLALNLIPVANYMFALGGAAGAALWAADIELKGQKWLRIKDGQKRS